MFHTVAAALGLALVLIRQEYAFVPEALFRQRREAILRSFLDRSYIYSTARFQSSLEERARANLRR